MGRDAFRKIGAITGLVLGIIVMRLAGQGGILPGAVFGAGGAVIGGICGEQIYGVLNGKE